MSNDSRLGELLVREKLISINELQKAREYQKASGDNLGKSLTKLGYVSDAEVTEFIANQYNVPAVDLDEYELESDIIELIPQDVAERHKILPISRAGTSLVVAMVDPTNLNAIDDVKFLTGYNVEPVVASEAAIDAVLERHYAAPLASYEDVMDGFDESEFEFQDGDDVDNDNVLELEKLSEDAPVVRLVNLILVNAIKKNASDIHVETYEKMLRVRYRVDGVLHEEMRLPFKLRGPLISRIKIMSRLDIAERRLPQDGRIKLKLGKGREMDFRVSVLPTLFGEKVVLRLLDKSNLQLDMTKLGFDTAPLQDFKDAIHQPYGMVLVTGPTGSGKTTTLYSALSELNRIDVNISTAEDPVEFNLNGINQVHMHEDIGLNFAAALRSFLRQDPDIIMVGEIRDFETAEIAVKAALTGHMVLSTLHTNDAPSTISRLLNMGVEPFLVTASINVILAQRLGRRICKECAKPAQLPPDALLAAGVTEEQLAGGFVPMEGTGCPACNDTGFKGRVALYEVMVFHDELKELVLQGCSTAELKAEAIQMGMQTLRMSGIRKVKEGVTTLGEVLRVTASD
jgi:type IV pilus assembly protein PilB